LASPAGGTFGEQTFLIKWILDYTRRGADQFDTCGEKAGEGGGQGAGNRQEI